MAKQQGELFAWLLGTQARHQVSTDQKTSATTGMASAMTPRQCLCSAPIAACQTTQMTTKRTTGRRTGTSREQKHISTETSLDQGWLARLGQTPNNH